MGIVPNQKGSVKEEDCVIFLTLLKQLEGNYETCKQSSSPSAE